MTIADARRLVAGTETAQSARSPAMQAGAVEAFAAAPPERKQELAEAMWTLLDEGESDERELASYFFTSVTAPDDVRRKIVAAYVARGWDVRDPSARTLAHFVSKLSPDEVKALRGVYLADPARQPHLPEVLLRSDDDGAVWRALAAELAKTDDVSVFLRAYNAVAMAPARAPDFYALLGKREKVARAMEGKLGSYMGGKLLAACGLK